MVELLFNYSYSNNNKNNNNNLKESDKIKFCLRFPMNLN